jgi:hypothetical protein
VIQVGAAGWDVLDALGSRFRELEDCAD